MLLGLHFYLNKISFLATLTIILNDSFLQRSIFTKSVKKGTHPNYKYLLHHTHPSKMVNLEINISDIFHNLSSVKIEEQRNAKRTLVLKGKSI